MRLKEGLPFICGSTGVYGIVIGYDDTDAMHYYCKKGKLYTKSLLQDTSKIMLEHAALNGSGLCAKIIATETSSALYGNKQRKEDLAGAVLPVIHCERTPKGQSGYVVTLQTYRTDGATLAMDYDDLMFVYPTLADYENPNTLIKSGSNVVAIKLDECSKLKKNLTYTVIRIEASDTSKQLDLFHLKTFDAVGQKESPTYFSYRKNFKIKE